jgi:hypothetical protein
MATQSVYCEVGTESLNMILMRRSGYALGPVRVKCLADHVCIGQGFMPSTSVFPCQYHSTYVPYSFIDSNSAVTGRTCGRSLGTMQESG